VRIGAWPYSRWPTEEMHMISSTYGCESLCFSRHHAAAAAAAAAGAGPRGEFVPTTDTGETGLLSGDGMLQHTVSCLFRVSHVFYVATREPGMGCRCAAPHVQCTASE